MAIPVSWGPPAALRALLAVPPAAIRATLGPPPEVDGQRLQPAVQLLLALSDRVGAGTGGPDETPEQRRANLRRSAPLAMPRPRGVRAFPLTILGPSGPLPARVYRPAGWSGPLPTIVYFHGGGWVVGDLDTHDGTCRAIAIGAAAVVVSVAYRLAPEHRYPAAVDDAVAAFRWVRRNAGTLGSDPGPVGVMGDSAGGNLAALVCLRERDADRPLPAAQGLVYPGTDLRRATVSTDLFAAGYFLTRADMDWFVGHYLADEALAADPQVSPLLRDDLSGLPPAGVWTAGFDPLRDEGNAYAERLADAGATVRHHCYTDQVHGFLGMGVLPGGLARAVDVAATMGGLLRLP